MGLARLSSRAIVGEFYNRLETDLAGDWVGRLGMKFQSDQSSEEYAWLGMAPTMREWVGGRQEQLLRDFGIIIPNLHYEATLGIPTSDIRRDKTGQVLVRVAELARRTNDHWALLLSALILAAESTACYDGQFFFDTDHVEGDSGVQSNDIVFDISDAACPVDEKGTATSPGPRIIAMAIMAGIQQIYGFKDDQGQPVNGDARAFTVQVPVSFMADTLTALSAEYIGSGITNPLKSQQLVTVTPVVNPRLTWTTKLGIFRDDGIVKPFIIQEETPVSLKAIAEGSEEEFKNDRWLFGVDAWRNVGFGDWRHACLVTLQA
jgi:hypothetical protein